MMRAPSLPASTLVLLLSCVASGDEDGGQNAKDDWQRLFREQASAYRIEVGESGRAELLAQPVLQWTHPARGGAHGAIFLWVKDGLPVVIGTLNIWPLDNGLQRVAHELHSLSQVPLTAIWRTRTWTPPKDSVEWQSLASHAVAAGPWAGREQRLRQMRELAGEFTARSRDRDNRAAALRLLPRPLYRYDLGSKANGRPRDVIDGAVFGFVEGTDLEVVLLMELRPAAEGAGWWYAAARMSDYSLELVHDERIVWHVDFGEYDRSTAPYYCSSVEVRQAPDEK